jgi:hypothetical protein
VSCKIQLRLSNTIDDSDLAVSWKLGKIKLLMEPEEPSAQYRRYKIGEDKGEP